MFKFYKLLFITVLLFGGADLFAGEESGEIRLPGLSQPDKKNESNVSKNKAPIEVKEEDAKQKKTSLTKKKNDIRQKNLKKEKHYKIKLYIVYIILLLSLIYLLVTYRKKKRRL